MKVTIVILVLILCNSFVFAKKTLNIYIWGGEISNNIIQKFEKKTGIKVNLSTYDSNETMYMKMKISKNQVYDIILPSSYFVERMKKQGMLQYINHKKIPNIINLDKKFMNNSYDPNNSYSIPLTWGITGIFYNKKNINKNNIPNQWSSLWKSCWKRQLMLLDDIREIFSIALINLGYDPNDQNENHIIEAYHYLLKLKDNIKLFSSNNVQTIITDEEVLIGSSWNSDAFKAQTENKNIRFIYPKNGYIMWIDCLAIPKNPPHLQEAYKFINFILDANISRQITLMEGLSITNKKGFLLLPKNIRNNPIIFPNTKIYQRAKLLHNLNTNTISIYSKYWQLFKLSF